MAQATVNLQHRGPIGTGFAVVVNEEIIVGKEEKLARSLFKDRVRIKPELIESQMGIAHVTLLDLQPIKIKTSPVGQFALAFNGRIVNRKEILNLLKDPSFAIGTDAEILAKIVGQSESCFKGIKDILHLVKGAFSAVLLTPEDLYAFRDPLGFKPLTIGRSHEGCAVASESVALDKLDMERIRDVRPGEIIRIEKDGFRTLYQMETEKTALCAFEFSYFARTPTYIDGISVIKARHNMGRSLAKKDEVKAHIVFGLPLSGLCHAGGYHLESGIPFLHVFEYNRYSDRSWTSSTRESSDEIAKDKLAINEEAIKDKDIILVDDSIFEAIQIGDWIKALKKKGAGNVHIRISTPPVIKACPYDFPNRINKELITYDHSEEDIRKKIRADTLLFNTPEDFVAAIISAQDENTKTPLKKENLCMYCLTGESPT